MNAITKHATPKPAGLGTKILNGLFYLPNKATGVDLANAKSFKQQALDDAASHGAKAGELRVEASDLARKIREMREGKLDGADLPEAEVDLKSTIESANNYSRMSGDRKAYAASRDPKIKRETRIMWGSRGVLGGGAIGAVLAAKYSPGRSREKTAGAMWNALKKGGRVLAGTDTRHFKGVRDTSLDTMYSAADKHVALRKAYNAKKAEISAMADSDVSDDVWSRANNKPDFKGMREEMGRTAQEAADAQQRALDAEASFKKERLKTIGSRVGVGATAGGTAYAATRRPTEKTAGAIDALRKGLSRYGALVSGKAAKAARAEANRFRPIRDAIHRANPDTPPNSLEAKYRARLKRPKPDAKQTMRGMADSMLRDRERAAQAEEVRTAFTRKRTLKAGAGAAGVGALVYLGNLPAEKTAGAMDALRKGWGRYKGLMSGKASKAAKEEVGRFQSIRDAIHRANPRTPPNSLEAKYRERLKRPKPDVKETMRGMADSMLKDRLNAARSEGRKTLGARA